MKSEEIFSINSEINLNYAKITKSDNDISIQLNNTTTISLSNEQLHIVKNWNEQKNDKDLIEFEELMVCLKYHDII